jgi:hypothetical protein
VKRLSLLTCLLLCLTSCSRLDLGIRFFSFYVKSEIDDMFDLEGPQRELLNQNFSKRVDLLKKQQFPKYAEFLEKIVAVYETQDDSDSSERAPSVTAEKISQLFDEGHQLMLSLPPQWKETVESLVMSLTPAQFKNFEDYFEDYLEKQKRKIATSRDREKKLQKSMETWIDETIEDLTPAQEAKLKAYVQANPAPAELSLKSQEHVFQQFREGFQDPEKRKKMIQVFVTDWKSFQLPDYVKARELHVAKLKDYIVDLGLNLNERQRKNLIQNLKKRISELRSLSHR